MFRKKVGGVDGNYFAGMSGRTKIKSEETVKHNIVLAPSFNHYDYPDINSEELLKIARKK